MCTKWISVEISKEKIIIEKVYVCVDVEQEKVLKCSLGNFNKWWNTFRELLWVVENFQVPQNSIDPSPTGKEYFKKKKFQSLFPHQVSEGMENFHTFSFQFVVIHEQGEREIGIITENGEQNVCKSSEMMKAHPLEDKKIWMLKL